MAKFQPGESGNAAGKVPGTKNRATREIREIARKLVENPVYLKSLRARMIDGSAPSLEILMFHFAFGKPVDRVATVNTDGFAYQLGEETSAIVALIADLRIILGREDEVAPEPTKLSH